jgi:phosphatidylglycerol:prolipoprotein diacylglycerol transferase
VYPEFFRIGDAAIGAHGVLLAAGVVVATLLVVRESRRLPQGWHLSPAIGIAAYASGLVGARLAYVLGHHSLREAWRALLVHEPGLTWWGGAVGAALACLVYLRLTAPKLPLEVAAGLGAPYLALAEAFVRVGCFLAGCCWGRPSAMPWAVTFPVGSWAHREHVEAGLIPPDAVASAPVHPWQLYMTLSLAALFLALRACRRGRLPDGRDAALFALGYGALRFPLEFLRADRTELWLPLNAGQWVCLALMTGGGVWLLRRIGKKSVVWRSLAGQDQEAPGSKRV